MISMTNQPRRSIFFWIVLLVCGVYAGYFAFTVYALARYYGVEKAPGWEAQTDGRAWYVSNVDGAGPAAGRIQLGDRLLAINGDERYEVEGLLVWRFVEGGKSYRVDVERSGERVSFELPLPVVSGQRLTPILGLVGLAFFICGAALVLMRPYDPQVRLAGAFLMSVGFVTLHQPLQAAYPFLVGWERIVHYGVIPLCLWTLPLAYHFFSRFPEGNSPGLLWRGIQWVLYAIFILVIWPAWVLIYLNFGIGEGVSRFILTHPPLFTAGCYIINFWMFPYIIICFVLTLIVIVRNYRHLRDRDSRRRIRWVVAGVIIALVPFVGLTFAFNVAAWIGPETYWLYYPVSFTTMLCIPASIGAAVWKEQLFDIRVLVRRGLQYLFARTALRILLALPIALLAISILSNPNRTVAQILTQGSGWLNIVLIGAIAATLRWRRPVQTWLDRRFFREDYQHEQVLVRLIDEVRQRDSLAEISQLVGARLESVLHPTSLHIFYRERGDSDFISGGASTSSRPPQQISAPQ